MNDRILYVTSFLFITVFSCQTSGDRSTKPPNIIILLADDLGYSDLGSYSGEARTPFLDQLAESGIRFTDFYAAAPNCSPSRVGLLTGRSPSKVGMYNYIPPNHPMHLKAEEITIAEIAKKAGYQTAHFGKWHVSCLPQNPKLNQPQPNEQGFDYSLGAGNNAQPSHLNPTNFVRNGEHVGEIKGYSCDIITDEAIEWLENKKSSKNPFLLYMAFHEPHKKVASPPDLIAHYPSHGEKDAEYLANVENLDRAIGKLIQYIDDNKLRENTLIIFASDNGSYRNGSNAPLLGGKSFVYEGGIRVPGIMSWPGIIPAEKLIDEPVGLIDIMPTICELTQEVHPNSKSLDGTSMMPIFSNKSLNRTKPLSWFFYRTSPEMAMRIGDYVILGRNNDSTLHTHPTTQPDMDHIKNMTLDDFEIYHLLEDVSQEHPLDWAEVPDGESFKAQLVARLKEIQAEGPYWDDLPEATTRKRMKYEWRTLRPEGFSN